MNHMGLFEGIGGFSLAARWAGIETVAQVEIDPFCLKVLDKNFPNAIKYKDIYEFDGTQYKGKIDIITGGFPCQPVSLAGQRNGTKDDRWLWPEMFRVIREVESPWVVIENVPGLLSIGDGMVFENLLADMGAAGYETQAFNIPAAGVVAPHYRYRIWIVAYSYGILWDRRRNKNGQNQGREIRESFGNNGDGLRTVVTQCNIDNTDTNSKRQQERRGALADEAKHAGSQFINSDIDGDRQLQPQGSEQKQRQRTGNGIEYAPDAEISKRKQPVDSRDWRTGFADNRFANWFEAATSLCRIHDGLPRQLDSRKRIKALGNAVEPHIPYNIFKAIIKTTKLFKSLRNNHEN